MSGTLKTVPEIFESIVERAAGDPAVIFGDETLGYDELNTRANRLARSLIAKGVGPDALVAVAVPRSPELVVVLLAVMKAGGAYLPLDPSYPGDRLSHMLTDARPVLVVRTEGTVVPDAGVPEIVVDEPAFAAACDEQPGGNIGQDERLGELRPANLMYVIYTSGSTGVPKGVAVSHTGVSDMVATQASLFGVRPGERVIQWASMSFDAGYYDVALALLHGATLVLAPREELLPGEPLRETLIKHDITHAVLPPVALSVTDGTDLLQGGTIMSTGDACTPALVREWSQGRRMYNGYGPTEVTVGASIAGPITDAQDVSIGTPWIGGQVYVLDDKLGQASDGEEGELYLAGSGLARGYLNRAGLSATRFVPDPFGPPGTLMYRSGDKGLRKAGGELYFTGRADDQVKIRGFRVEMGEVEARLAEHEAVDVAVTVVGGGLADARIVGYVTAVEGTDVTEAELRAHVAQTLPDHMVPALVRVLDEFPTTPNGKADRAKLREAATRALTAVETPARSASGAASGVRDAAAFEEALCTMVMEILGKESVTGQDNFFELGGQSVLAVQLGSRIRKELGVKVPMRSVLEAPTLADLARSLEETAGR
ncbi:amino acid adenylation domain-containing protein [Streptomyces alboflavus]|uniref:non-ribosomal peptide synthetase n=1 Tax=Streptomyces alboflavus TaxID=67267 RepID=UPI00368A6ACF